MNMVFPVFSTVKKMIQNVFVHIPLSICVSLSTGKLPRSELLGKMKKKILIDIAK